MLNERQEETSEVIFEQLTPQTEVHFHDYDSSLSIFSRQDYMDFLLKIKEVFVNKRLYQTMSIFIKLEKIEVDDGIRD